MVSVGQSSQRTFEARVPGVRRAVVRGVRQTEQVVKGEVVDGNGAVAAVAVAVAVAASAGSRHKDKSLPICNLHHLYA